MISYNAENVSVPPLRRREVNKWIRRTAAAYGMRVGDLAYVFVDDAKILETNRQYLGHDYYTDVITFDYTQGHLISGDIFISLDTVRSNSEEQHTTYGEELLRVIIHGVLHLCGLKDKSPDERAEMENAENLALSAFLGDPFTSRRRA